MGNTIWIRGNSNSPDKVINALVGLGGRAPRSYNGEPKPDNPKAIFFIAQNGMIEGLYISCPKAQKIMRSRFWRELIIK